MSWWKATVDWLLRRKGTQQVQLQDTESAVPDAPVVPQVPEDRPGQPRPTDVPHTDELKPPAPGDANSTRTRPAVRAPAVSPHRSRSKAITVGLDFGTHSTKILFRPRNDDEAVLFPVRKSHDGYPRFASPSLVRIADGRAYFGGKALEVRSGKLFRSLKVQLLPPAHANEPAQEFPSGLTPDLLVAFYLSWTLKRIRAAIDGYWRHGQPKVFLNMAAPMNHVGNESLKIRYLQIVQAAWESVFGSDPFPAQQGSTIDELQPRFEAWLEKEVSGKEVRPFDVLPETIAPIVSLSFDPRMDPGMYMIVDMGAGTTEFSVIHVGEPGADQQVPCYYDESVIFGGDNFEWIDKKGETGTPDEEGIHRLVKYFLKVFHRTWGKGYQKDGRNPAARDRWRDFRVLLVGGGARRPEVEKAIRVALPMTAWPVGESTYPVSWHEPSSINMGKTDSGQTTELRSLLAVANGLSFPRQQWPKFWFPQEITTQESPETIDRPPPYWYVD